MFLDYKKSIKNEFEGELTYAVKFKDLLNRLVEEVDIYTL